MLDTFVCVQLYIYLCLYVYAVFLADPDPITLTVLMLLVLEFKAQWEKRILSQSGNIGSVYQGMMRLSFSWLNQAIC